MAGQEDGFEIEGKMYAKLNRKVNRERRVASTRTDIGIKEALRKSLAGIGGL